MSFFAYSFLATAAYRESILFLSAIVIANEADDKSVKNQGISFNFSSSTLIMHYLACIESVLLLFKIA